MAENIEEYTLIDDLKPNLRSINIKVKCTSKNEERTVVSRSTGEILRITEALVGDETGSVYLTLWNKDIDQIEIDHVYKLKNVYTKLFKGSLRLNIGRYGNCEEIDREELVDLNTENNLSDKYYEQSLSYHSNRGYSGGYGSDQGSYKHNKSGYYRKKRY